MSSESTVTLQARFVDDISPGIRAVHQQMKTLESDFRSAKDSADVFTSGLRGLAESENSLRNQLQNTITGLKAQKSAMQDAGFREAKKEAETLKAELAAMEAPQQGFASKMGGMATAIKGFIALQAVGYLKDMGMAIFDATAEMQSLKMGMTAVMKSSTLAAAEMEKLKEVAKLPGLGYSEAVRMSLSLQSAGMSADMARKAMLSFGNALATVGKGKAELDGVGLALSQIMSKGKVSAEEINQIAERVPQIRIAMQDAFGTANTEMIQKMGLTSGQFIRGITEELGKLEKVTGGLRNGADNLDDAWTRFKANIGGSGSVFQATLDILASGLEKANALLEGADKEAAQKKRQREVDSAMASIAWTKRVVAEEIAAGRVLSAAEQALVDKKLNGQRAILAKYAKMDADAKAEAERAAKELTDGQKDLLQQASKAKKATMAEDLKAEEAMNAFRLKEAKGLRQAIEAAEQIHKAKVAEIEERWKKKGPKEKTDPTAKVEAESAKLIQEEIARARAIEKIREQTQIVQLNTMKSSMDEGRDMRYIDREIDSINLQTKFQDDQTAAKGDKEKLLAIQEKYRADILALNARYDALEANDEAKATAAAIAYAKRITDKEKERREKSAEAFNKQREDERDSFQKSMQTQLAMHNGTLTTMLRGKSSFAAASRQIEDDMKNWAIQKGLEKLEGWIAQQITAMVFADAARTTETAKAAATGSAQTAAYAPAAAMASVASWGTAAVVGGAALAAVAATYFAMRETGGSTLGSSGLVVGEKRPEYFQPTTPGQIHNSTTTHNTFGGVTVNVSGGGDPRAIAAAVVRAQKMQARGRMGTSH